MNKNDIQANNPEKIKDEIVKEVVGINQGKAGDAQIRPNLAVVAVGGDESMISFVDNLEKESKKVGVDTHIYKCPQDSDEDEIRAMIECLNEDNLINGILLQLPLPDKFNQEEVLALIKAEKDLSFIMEGDEDRPELREAKIFKACLDNFKTSQIEEL